MRRSLVGWLGMEGFERWSGINAVFVQISTEAVSTPAGNFKAAQPSCVVYRLRIALWF